MKAITKEMIKIYNMKDFDFMGYTLTKEPEFHHIVKKEHNGKYEISNGAVLNTDSHRYLHTIEYKDLIIYQAINDMFRIINKKGYIDIEDLKIINVLLREFECEYKDAKNSKGKILIKPEYYDRKYNIIKK